MLSKTVVFAALAATVAADAAVHPGHLEAKRAFEVAARSTADAGSATATACLGALLGLYSTIPTPPPALLSYEEANTATDPCHYTVPPSLSADFTSYESEILGWYTSNSAAINSALSQCPQYSSLATNGAVPNLCSTTAGGAAATGATVSSGSTATVTGGSGSGSGSGSGGSGSTGTGSSSPSKTGSGGGAVTTNGASHQTGLIGAALAGLIVAVAYL